MRGPMGATNTVSGALRPWTATRTSLWLRFTATDRKYLLAAVDLLLLNASLLTAVTAWNGFEPSAQAILASWKWFLTLSVLWLAVGTTLDIYSLPRSASTTASLASTGAAALLCGFLYVAIPWLTPPINARLYVDGFLLLSLATVEAWRLLYAQVLAQPAFTRRALVFRGGDSSSELLDALRRAGQASDANPFRGTGYQIVGIVADDPVQDSDSGDQVPVLGPSSQLVGISRQHQVDEIVVAMGDEPMTPGAQQALLDCRELGLEVHDLASIYERLTGRLQVEYATYNLHLILGAMDTMAYRLYALYKRGMDLLGAALGLVVLMLACPFIALANAIWSPGPLFFRQQRVGRKGRSFAVVKLRSMRPDAEKATGVVWCDDGDPRISPVGRWLRKSRLDELPQVINVLRGEMSLVGPRPERPQFVGQLARSLPLYRARHAVKPGITGWAQVNYPYARSVEDSRIKLEYDLYYVKHAGPYLDLLVLLHTVRTVLGLKG